VKRCNQHHETMEKEGQAMTYIVAYDNCSLVAASLDATRGGRRKEHGLVIGIMGQFYDAV
jgi:hypothetical protein